MSAIDDSFSRWPITWFWDTVEDCRFPDRYRCVITLRLDRETLQKLLTFAEIGERLAIGKIAPDDASYLAGHCPIYLRDRRLAEL